MGKDTYICRTNKKKKTAGSWLLQTQFSLSSFYPSREICECVQIETALSERHCILKQGHGVFITLSRSIHVTLTQLGQNTWGLLSAMPRREGNRSLCSQGYNSHTTGGYQPSIMTLIENKLVRSELEVVIWSRSVVLETTSTVKLK